MYSGLRLLDDKENVLLILHVLFSCASERVNKENRCVNSLITSLFKFLSCDALLVGNIFLTAVHEVECPSTMQLCVSSKFRRCLNLEVYFKINLKCC